jgi:hypothetical protein
MRATLLLIVAALAVARPAAAQHADLSGMWILQDPGSGDWQAWYDLGLSTQGAERHNALRIAAVLNPHAPELAALAH